MCGIAGWIDGRREAALPSVLERMAHAIRHRGPDGSGEHFTETADGRHSVALAHRRLAIIDLATGGQPMHSADGAVTIVFNGEIYNFRELRSQLEQHGHHFVTASDTEALLYAYITWGTDCLRRLRGMFAFAIWDSRRQQLFLARDRFGKKPLYLWEDGGRLVFGSEIKALLAHPAVAARLDRQSVLDYLTYRYVPGPHTLFQGIRKLAPGGYALWRDGRLEERLYYTPPDAGEGAVNGLPPGDLVETFFKRLDECVHIRMVSDVPYGAFLSGGIDSSAVVALMSRHSNRPVNTFAVGFAEAAYCEMRYARMVAARYRTNHHELVVSAGHLMEHLPKLIAFRDAPVAEPSDIPFYLLSVEAAKTVKMVLTGEGADEFLAGYPKYLFEPYVHHYQRLVPAALHRILVEPLMDWLPYRFRRVKTLASSLGIRDPQERLPRWFGALSFAQREALTDLAVAPRHPDPRPFAPAARSPLNRILHFDQTSWLPDNLLERGDRMTMAASIEARMPFMDHLLADLVARLPRHFRIRFLEQKRILRQAVRHLLPSEILQRPKIGFRVPVNEWFRGSMRDFVYDHLTGPQAMTAAYYDRAELDRLITEHVTGRQNHEKLIWSLVSLELFQRQYRLS